MRLFIDIYNSELEMFVHDGQGFKTHNLRFLLKEYDDKYPLVELVPYFDAIMREHQELSGQESSKRHYEKLDSKEWTKYKMKAIELALFSLEMGYKQGAIDLIDNFKLKCKPTKDALTRKFKSINNRVKLQIGKEREEQAKERKKVIWNDLRVQIEQKIKIMPEYNCSVALYLSYEKQAKSA